MVLHVKVNGFLVLYINVMRILYDCFKQLRAQIQQHQQMVLSVIVVAKLQRKLVLPFVMMVTLEVDYH